MEIVNYEVGKTLFSEGDPSISFFKIISGLVEITHWDVERDQEMAIAQVGPGEELGASGVVMREPRACSAVAVEPTTCARYGAEEVGDFLLNEPDWVCTVVQGAKSRIKFWVTKYPDAHFSVSPSVEQNTGEEFLELLRNDPDEALACLRVLMRQLNEVVSEVGRIIAGRNKL